MTRTNSPNSVEKKRFQIDRIAFFSDAIIAIASTLLILEFKIPPLGKNHTWSQIMNAYSGKFLIPIFGLVISFYSISRLWLKHHTLFEHIVDYNRRFIIINQFFLFFIMILPVSTSFVLEDDNPYFLRIFFYFCNLGLCNISFYFLMKTAILAKNKISELTPEEIEMVQMKDRSLIAGNTFMLAGILSLFTIKYFYFAFIPSILFRLYKRIAVFFK